MTDEFWTGIWNALLGNAIIFGLLVAGWSATG